MIMMKKKIVIITLLLSVFSIIFIYRIKDVSPQNNPIIINGIENFKPVKQQTEDSYLLFYPSDARTSQKHTIVKEVAKNGEIIREYEIRDEDFRRTKVHQKPNDSDQLYMSLFGEAVIENWYYTYDINNQTFKKVELDYFTYDVGISHILHYGEDILFQTIVSHKTGDQVLNEETKDFKVSLSNYTKHNSYETEWGHVPICSPLLQLGDKIFYAEAGKVNEKGLRNDSFVGVINENTQSVEYINFNKGASSFYTAYSTPNQAYIIGNNGRLFVVDKNLNYKIFEPFSDLPKGEKLYYIYNASLMLSNDIALHEVYNYETETFTLGLLSLKDTPTFTPLQKDYLNEKNSHKILYQDTKNGLIYLIEKDDDKNEEYLIVLDNKSFDLIDKISIEYSHLLDLVIKL